MKKENKCHCPFCGQKMESQFSSGELVQATCVAGQMKLHVSVIDLVNRAFFGEHALGASIQESWLKGPLFCMKDGSPMSQKEVAGDMIRTALTCSECQHRFPSGLVMSLVQNHSHKK